MKRIYKSYAKINLHLQVVARREDGFHELETVFQSGDLADRIQVELTSGGVDLRIRSGDAPAGDANLAFRAARAFLDRWAPESGVRLELSKEVPIGGGLGGGSSNAATVLLALREMVASWVGDQELHEVAAELGADVPYFLMGGTVLGRGRGDELYPLEDLPERPVWMVTPPVSISTAEVFGGFDLSTLRPRGRDEMSNWTGALTWKRFDSGWNDLEMTVRQRYPVVADVYNVLVDEGASLVRLSGTGATLFAFFVRPPEISELTRKLPQGSRVVQTRTLTRASLGRLRVVR